MSKTVFTNGCFDIIHAGHVDLLRRARELGTRLVVGINSDSSVRAIKGPDRPFVAEEERAEVLSGLRFVDEVVVFDDPTPEKLIEQIKPDVLVKGGDWSENEIIGADFVRRNGGEVHSLPLVDGHSSTSIVDRIRGADTREVSERNDESVAVGSIVEHLGVFEELLNQCIGPIEDAGAKITSSIQDGNKILICGNGGSAADAQHIAAEFVGRYEAERPALAAVALTTDTSALTALSNDYGFEKVFERQVAGLANRGDVLIAISTSGNSPNVLAAVMKAREKGCVTIGLTGSKGKKLAALCDSCVMVPSDRTSRIQEAHITIGHIWCAMTDRKIVQG